MFGGDDLPRALFFGMFGILVGAFGPEGSEAPILLGGDSLGGSSRGPITSFVPRTRRRSQTRPFRARSRRPRRRRLVRGDQRELHRRRRARPRDSRPGARDAPHRPPRGLAL